MLLSVVIPFYNVEAYLEECLSRAAMLDAQEAEVILVDDCGQDGSAAIAEAFTQGLNNFRVIRREKNGGLSAARNTGLKEAQGEYVYFLDSDDLPEPQELMTLARRAKLFDLDVAKARFVFFDDETGKETPGAAVVRTEVMSGAQLFASQCAAGVYEPMVWQCVYRRDYLEKAGLEMAEGLLFEDELFQAPALIGAARAGAFDEVILRYRQREGSIMKSFAKNSRWCESYLQVCRRLSALAKNVPDAEAKKALCRRVGQIALSVVKNVPAYRLPEDVAAQVMEFARTHKDELSGYAIHSGDAAVAAQGLLLKTSPKAFLNLYRRA